MKRLYDFLAPWRPGGLQGRHYHGVITIAIVAVLIFILGAGIGGTVTYKIASDRQGGFIKKHLPPPVRVMRGALPSSYNLFRFVIRIHQQDGSNSCVAQTGSEIEEITLAEQGIHIPMSAGYIYNQYKYQNLDDGMTYPALGYALTQDGDAPLSVFGYDGVGDVWAQPGPLARQVAARYRMKSWFSIGTTDIGTMEYELAHGHPFGVALHIYASFLAQLNSGQTVYVSGQGGAGDYFVFDHSMTAVGYDSSGLWLLNHYGPPGYVHITWDFLAAWNNGDSIGFVPNMQPKPPLMSKVNQRIWNQYRAEHHKPLISFKKGSSLTPAARYWVKHTPAHTGGILKAEQWFPRGRHGLKGFEEDFYQGYDLIYWPRFKGEPHKWLLHRWAR